MMEDKVNLDGEFLGISSLAIYSAPWFLRVLLLTMVMLLFVVKVSRHSKQLRTRSELQSSAKSEHLVADINQFFFGFTLPAKQLASYWMGFLICLITLAYAIYDTYVHLFT